MIYYKVTFMLEDGRAFTTAEQEAIEAFIKSAAVDSSSNIDSSLQINFEVEDADELTVMQKLAAMVTIRKQMEKHIEFYAPTGVFSPDHNNPDSYAGTERALESLWGLRINSLSITKPPLGDFLVKITEPAELAEQLHRKLQDFIEDAMPEGDEDEAAMPPVPPSLSATPVAAAATTTVTITSKHLGPDNDWSTSPAYKLAEQDFARHLGLSQSQVHVMHVEGNKYEVTLDAELNADAVTVMLDAFIQAQAEAYAAEAGGASRPAGLIGDADAGAGIVGQAPPPLVVLRSQGQRRLSGASGDSAAAAAAVADDFPVPRSGAVWGSGLSDRWDQEDGKWVKVSDLSILNSKNRPAIKAELERLEEWGLHLRK